MGADVEWVDDDEEEYKTLCEPPKTPIVITNVTIEDNSSYTYPGEGFWTVVIHFTKGAP